MRGSALMITSCPFRGVNLAIVSRTIDPADMRHFFRTLSPRCTRGSKRFFIPLYTTATFVGAT